MKRIVHIDRTCDNRLSAIHCLLLPSHAASACHGSRINLIVRSMTDERYERRQFSTIFMATSSETLELRSALLYGDKQPLVSL